MALGGFIKIAFVAFVIYAVVNIVSVQVTLADKREQLAALEFSASTAVKVLSGGADAPLGYIDMDQIDDLLLALETILETKVDDSDF